MLQDYVITASAQPKVNWDAALTLGTCIIVCGAVISPVISKVYRRYRVNNQRLWNVLLGIIATSVLFVGSLSAVTLLGYWSAGILKALEVEQGVHRPWTPKGLRPIEGGHYVPEN